MISSMFILLVALIPILGLHCAYSNKNNIKHSEISEPNNEIQLKNLVLHLNNSHLMNQHIIPFNQYTKIFKVMIQKVLV